MDVPDTRSELVAIGGLAAWMLAELGLSYRVFDLAGAPDRAAMLGQCAQATVAVTTGTTGIDADTIARLPRLGLVACFGVGYDRVDRAALAERRIALTNTPGVVATCVADHAMGLLIALVRRIAHADRLAHAGIWGKQAIGLTTRVSGKRLGILGLGEIGLRIVQRAAGFEMPIGYHNRRLRPEQPHVYFDSPLELARWADCLVLACPGGADTRHLVDAAVLDALGPHGVLVNIARGSVVDEAALIDALQAGRLGAAALDVFENEPGIPPALAALDNVVLTPHLGGSTQETWRDAFDLMHANVAAFLAGRALPTPVGV